MKLSVVSTMYSSGRYVREFYVRMCAAATEVVGDDFEIILIDDGSPDDSYDIAVELAEQDSRVVVIELSRNFGHHNAMLAGLSYAQGERIFLIDIDLEESPEWVTEFSQQMKVERLDVVYGVQNARKGNWFERLSGATYYLVLNALLGIKHPQNITTARLMTGSYVQALLSYTESVVVISCLMHITGFRQAQCPVTKQSRGRTSYTLMRKVRHVVNAVTSFSGRPLVWIFAFGCILSLSATCFGAWLIVQKMFLSTPLAGWTSVMVSVWLLAGLIILFLGVIGIYLSQIFKETKGRPTFIVRSICNGHEH